MPFYNRFCFYTWGYANPSIRAVVIGNPTELDFQPGVDDFSVSFWFRRRASGGDSGYVLTKRYTSGTQFSLSYDYSPDGLFTLNIGGNNLTNSSFVVDDELWHFIVITVSSGGVATLFLDGIESSFTGSIGSTTVAMDWILSSARDADNTDFTDWNCGGYYNQLAFWDKVLTAYDVSLLFTGDDPYVQIPCDLTGMDGLVAWYRMGDANGDFVDGIEQTTMHDSGENELDATVESYNAKWYYFYSEPPFIHPPVSTAVQINSNGNLEVNGQEFFSVKFSKAYTMDSATAYRQLGVNSLAAPATLEGILSQFETDGIWVGFDAEGLSSQVERYKALSSIISWGVSDEPWAHGHTINDIKDQRDAMLAEDTEASRLVYVSPGNSYVSNLADAVGEIDYAVVQAGAYSDPLARIGGYNIIQNCMGYFNNGFIDAQVKIARYVDGYYRYSTNEHSVSQIRAIAYAYLIAGAKAINFYPHETHSGTLQSFENYVNAYNFNNDTADYREGIASIAARLVSRSNIFLSQRHTSVSVSTGDSSVVGAVYDVGGVPNLVVSNLKETAATHFTYDKASWPKCQLIDNTSLPTVKIPLDSGNKYSLDNYGAVQIDLDGVVYMTIFKWDWNFDGTEYITNTVPSEPIRYIRAWVTTDASCTIYAALFKDEDRDGLPEERVGRGQWSSIIPYSGTIDIELDTPVDIEHTRKYMVCITCSGAQCLMDKFYDNSLTFDVKCNAAAIDFDFYNTETLERWQIGETVETTLAISQSGDYVPYNRYAVWSNDDTDFITHTSFDGLTITDSFDPYEVKVYELMQNQDSSVLHNATADRVVFCYRQGDADSLEVANAYRVARGLSPDQLIALPCSSEAYIAESDYVSTIETPLLSAIEARETSVGSAGERETWVIILGYHVPIAYYNDDPYGDPYDPYAGPLKAIASRLHRLGFDEDDAYPNYTYNRRQFSFFDATDATGLYITAVINGPTKDDALRLIQRATDVINQQSITGKIYVDPYGLTSTGDQLQYRDDILEFINQEINFLGLDYKSTSVPIGGGDPLTQYLQGDNFYWGWYTPRYSKNLLLNQNERRVFLYNADEDGAATITSGFDLVNGSDPWCNIAIGVEPGYACCAGAVYAPGEENYLRPRPFFEALHQGATIGEAFLFASPVVDWRIILIGDPLMTVNFPTDVPPEQDITSDLISNDEGIFRIKESIEESLAYGMRQSRVLDELLTYVYRLYNLEEEMALLYNVNYWKNVRGVDNQYAVRNSAAQALITYVLRTTGMSFASWLESHEYKTTEYFRDMLEAGIPTDAIGDDYIYEEGSWMYEFTYMHPRQRLENVFFQMQLSEESNFSDIAVDANCYEANGGWNYESEPFYFAQIVSTGLPSSFNGRRIRYESPSTHYLTRTFLYYVRYRVLDRNGVPLADWTTGSDQLIIKR